MDGCLDRLEFALDRGLPAHQVEGIGREALQGARVHTVLELAALARDHPALRMLLPRMGALEGLGVLGGVETASDRRVYRKDDFAVWEVGPDGAEGLASKTCLVAFRDGIGRKRCPQKLAAQLFGMMSELLENAAEHGASPIQPVAAYDIRGTTWSFSVTDLGPGALATLRQNSAYSHLTTGLAALEAMLEDGATGTGVPGRGNGFRPLFQALADRQVSLRFRSSTGAIAWNAESPSLQNVAGRLLPHRRGFHVELHLPRPC